jgi:Flp pilus assembly protein TadG
MTRADAPRRFATTLQRLRDNVSGVAIIEFAYALPVLVVIGFWGVETANFAIANLRVSQIAALTADNAGRVRDSIDEADVNELLSGAKLVGTGIDFANRGRIILSDLEPTTADSTKQWIRWQRCSGAKSVTSSYGVPRKADNSIINNATEMTAPSDQTKSVPTDGTSNTTGGMGPNGNQVASSASTAVMFVEVQYDYKPLVTDKFLGARTIKSVSAFNVRQRTNQSLSNFTNVTPSKCSVFSA